jgi:hypothetical protein
MSKQKSKKRTAPTPADLGAGGGVMPEPPQRERWHCTGAPAFHSQYNSGGTFKQDYNSILNKLFKAPL